MIILTLFAFLAGIVTILSPCILPLLPIILATSVAGRVKDTSRPFGIIVGFVGSFTFFTLFLSTLVRLIGVPADALRTFSVIIITIFGLSLLIPRAQLLMESLFSRLANLMPNTVSKSGFWGGIIIGLSLGLLWTPCVGPILASVISLAITGTVTFNAFLITLAYTLGTAIPMLLVIKGGQNVLTRVPWLLKNTRKIQQVFGLVMIITALGIASGVDRNFQTYILTKFPQYGVGLTKLEDNVLVSRELDSLSSVPSAQGKTEAPELIAGGSWFNSNPLTLKELRGKVVLVDFWTYTCINCQRTFPYLKEWDKKYRDKGLVIIGVHSPEFEFEKNKINLQQAISYFGITYPVMQDNNFATWQAYGNRYWPAKYFVDKDGKIRATHFGEDDYDTSEKIIQDLLKETGANINMDINNPETRTYTNTPETYLGHLRIDNFASPQKLVKDQFSSYTFPAYLSDNTFAIEGMWLISGEYANPKAGGKLEFKYDAKSVYLVMRNSGKPAKVKVFLDNELVQTITITADQLYTLVDLESPGRHLLRLEFEDDNTQLFAFTFG
jgi:cytochrome c biogenesis protein CcdA/thiol-disulfide isomerase/thioredoxin